MSFKSQAQKERCARLVKEGKMSKEMFDKWDKATPEKIPARIHVKKPKKAKKK